ncbi:MAG: GNAT family N-acetyltransferase [Rhodospirillales bacterium]
MTDAATVDTLRDGRRILIRAIAPADRRHLVHGIALLSPRARQARFMTDRRGFTDAELDYLTVVDQHDHIALIALEAETGCGAAVGRCIRLAPGGTVAEVALTVLDRYQAAGLGTALLRRLAARAATVGVTAFRAEYAADNAAMARLAARYGGTPAAAGDGLTVVEIQVSRLLQPEPEAPPPPAPLSPGEGEF